jgi:hypothetical protein
MPGLIFKIKQRIKELLLINSIKMDGGVGCRCYHNERCKLTLYRGTLGYASQ